MTKCSFAVTTHQDKILLVRLAEIYAFAGHWSLPGGVVEPGQTLAESAAREVLEETGVMVEVGGYLDSFISGDNDITVFTASYIDGEIAVQESEIAAAGWFTFEEAHSLPLAYNVKDILAKLQGEQR